MPDGHLLFNSGVVRGKKQSGDGFLVNKKLTNSVLEFKPITEKLAYIKLRGRISNIYWLFSAISQPLKEQMKKWMNSMQKYKKLLIAVPKEIN